MITNVWRRWHFRHFSIFYFTFYLFLRCQIGSVDCPSPPVRSLRVRGRVGREGNCPGATLNCHYRHCKMKWLLQSRNTISILYDYYYGKRHDSGFSIAVKMCCVFLQIYLKHKLERGNFGLMFQRFYFPFRLNIQSITDSNLFFRLKSAVFDGSIYSGVYFLSFFLGSLFMERKRFCSKSIRFG